MTRVTALFLATLVTGCDLSSVEPGPQLYRWYNRAFQGNAGYEQLFTEALLSWVDGETRSVAEIAVNYDLPGATRPWHLHLSTCALGGEIVGMETNYTPLTPDDDGISVVGAALSVAANPVGTYHVDVHLSPTEMETTIVCLDLVPLQ
jgi:hypothetical protein